MIFCDLIYIFTESKKADCPQHECLMPQFLPLRATVI